MKGPGPAVAILIHPLDRFAQRPYFIRLLADRWRSLGLRVVVVDGPASYRPADVAILHVDLSVVPPAWERLADRYPRVLNRRVLDIRQRSFSRLLVEQGEHVAGELIVKTNGNCGGWNDFRRAVQEAPLTRLVPGSGRREAVCRALAHLNVRQPWRSRRVLRRGRYPVYATAASVSPGVWRNPHLVVERFLPERSGGAYCCRHWVFLGDREVSRRTVSPHPIVKLRDARLEPLDDPVPEELRAARRELGFDYGKFDYGLADGIVALYDVNPTPTATRNPSRHTEAIETLAEGIRAFLD